MKFITKNALFIGLSLLLVSCAAKVYTAPDSHKYTSGQTKIAVLPPNVSLQSGKFSGNFEQSKQEEALKIQHAMFNWILKRMGKNSAVQEIQDLETTNIKLKKAGYPENEYTKEELCGILGVDAVLGSNYVLSKPMPQGLAVAASVLTGYEGTTNRITATMNIYDKNAKKIIWNYGNDYSGTWRQSYDSVVEDLMRNASKKLPYGKK